jgi:hypothetical protein
MAGVSKLAALRFIALLAVLCFLSACGETHSWREKTIIEIETPNGTVTGGSVAEVTVHWFGSLEQAFSASAVSAGKRGEAGVLELAPGKYLFALTLDPEAARAETMFALPQDPNGKSVTARLETLRETRTVPAELYPRLVTFADVSDPKSVKLVDPSNLAAAFGPGFALKSVKLEVTDDNVTEGPVGMLLSWLAEYDNKQLDGSRYHDVQNTAIANNLMSGNFKVRGD